MRKVSTNLNEEVASNQAEGMHMRCTNSRMVPDQLRRVLVWTIPMIVISTVHQAHYLVDFWSLNYAPIHERVYKFVERHLCAVMRVRIVRLG